MEFVKKNDFIVKNKKEEYFQKDLDLFKMHCPMSGLHTEVKRLNSFNRSKIHGMILVELLDKVSIEDILANRMETLDKTSEQQPKVVDTVEGVKEIFASEMEMEHIEEDVFPYLVGKTEEEIRTLIALTRGSIKMSKTSLENPIPDEQPKVPETKVDEIPAEKPKEKDPAPSSTETDPEPKLVSETAPKPKQPDKPAVIKNLPKKKGAKKKSSRK
ncbi:hypothetical protein [Proteiniphilum sp.]|uniref:hypothetical protein n=1 Tax=Proteiniphilum sp. TaxID=1926877 RepID=UPI002B1F8701|nr:hypothetical protein [Proteiniphilum sp.]MEA4918141.1 hypothetical protein [Proteiniphilum sp.]